MEEQKKLPGSAFAGKKKIWMTCDNKRNRKKQKFSHSEGKREPEERGAKKKEREAAQGRSKIGA